MKQGVKVVDRELELKRPRAKFHGVLADSERIVRQASRRPRATSKLAPPGGPAACEAYWGTCDPLAQNLQGKPQELPACLPVHALQITASAIVRPQVNQNLHLKGWTRSSPAC